VSARLVLCEGPDDLAALRQIATQEFQAVSIKTARGSGAGLAREAVLQTPGGIRVRILGKEGKSSLPELAAAELNGLPAQGAEPAELRLSQIAIVYDPDGQTETAFKDEVAKALKDGASAWTIEATAGGFLAKRNADEVIDIRLSAWKGPGPVFDGLADLQSLERLICAVAAQAYPEEAKTVVKWLDEIATQKGKPPKWKGAVHLWCAIIEPAAGEETAPVRFLGQNKACRPFVRPSLQAVALVECLKPILGD
jgi:hypothetical protein